MKLAAIAGFAAGTAIVVYTFLRQHSDPDPYAGMSLSDIEAAQMCPNCCTPWKCNGPHILDGYTPTAQEIEFGFSYEVDGAGYEPAPPAVILADPRRN